MIYLARDWGWQPARRWIAYALFLLGAHTIGNAVCRVAEGCTLGGLVRVFLPSLAVLSVAFLVTVIDPRHFVSGFDLRDRGLLRDIALGSALASVSLPLLLIGQAVGLTYSLVGLIVLGGFSLACVWTFRREGPEGLVVLLLVLPFLAFLEWDFRATLLGGGEVGPLMVSPSIIAVWVFFVASFVPCLVRRQGIRLGRVGVYAGAWLFFIFLSSLAAVDPLTSLQEASLEILCFPLFFILVVNRVRTSEQAELVTRGVVSYGVLRIAIAYYFYVQVHQFDVGQSVILNTEQIYRVIDHVGLISCLSVFVMPLAIALVTIAHKWHMLALPTLGAVFFAFANLSSQARSTILPMAATFPFLILHRRRRLPILIGALVVGGGCVVLGATAQPELFSRFGNWYSLSDIVAGQLPRLDAWKVALKILRDYPLTGIGEGMWERYYTLYTERIFWWGKMRFYVNSAHQILLHQAATGGVPLLVAWICLIGAVIRRGAATIRQGRDEKARSLTVGYLWSFAGFLIVGMIGGVASLHMRTWDLRKAIDTGMMFWLAVGMITALGLVAHRGPGENRDEPDEI